MSSCRDQWSSTVLQKENSTPSCCAASAARDRPSWRRSMVHLCSSAQQGPPGGQGSLFDSADTLARPPPRTNPAARFRRERTAGCSDQADASADRVRVCSRESTAWSARGHERPQLSEFLSRPRRTRSTSMMRCRRSCARGSSRRSARAGTSGPRRQEQLGRARAWRPRPLPELYAAPSRVVRRPRGERPAQRDRRDRGLPRSRVTRTLA